MKAVWQVIILVIAMAGSVSAAEENLLQDLEQLKKSVVGLEQALSGLEQTLIYPDQTRMQVFVSLVSSQLKDVQSVKLRMNNRLIASHIYSHREQQALRHGAIQPLYISNISPGQHELSILVQGVDKQGKAWRDGRKFSFVKNQKSALLEFVVQDSSKKRRPEIGVRQW